MAGLTKVEAAEVETIRKAAFLMSAHQQYRLAFMIAENIGCEIVWTPSASGKTDPL